MVEHDAHAVATLEDDLAATFEAHGIDYVPDPMVMRSAELFLLGRSGCRAQLGESAADQTWSVIDKNMDGLLAFFHVLMTRDCVPLIDYKDTFPGSALMAHLGGLAVDVHPPRELYKVLVRRGVEQVQRMDVMSLDRALAADVATELGTAGYEWFPGEAQIRHFENDREGRTRQVLATFVLGGIIFGGYAQATRSDHLLQSKRARLFTQLTVPQDDAATWGFDREEQLYAQLRAMAEQVDRLRHADFTLPPSVVPLLIAEHAPSHPSALLEHALELRDSPLGEAYREWHRRVRSAWTQGRRDMAAETDVRDVADEVARRFGHARRERNVPTLNVSAGTGVQFGIGEVSASIEHEIPLGLPERVRIWLVDRLRFRGHRKMLLRMALDQATFDNLALGLKNMWWAA